MPINIYGNQTSDVEHIAWLCEGIWELSVQLDILEKWVTENQNQLPKGSYVADIGFCPQPDSEGMGGGGVLSVSAIRIMADVGMNLFFSEYPECDE